MARAAVKSRYGIRAARYGDVIGLRGRPTRVVEARDRLRIGGAVLIVHVHVHVHADQVEAFKAATLANARASVQEPGIARFDVVQQEDDPTRFVLVEVYRSAEAPALHKETEHYLRWRDAVAPMMASPRRGVRYANQFPDDGGW